MEDAEKILHRVAKVNKVPYPEDILLEEAVPSNAKTSGGFFAVLGLFKTCKMTIRVVVCFGVWYEF